MNIITADILTSEQLGAIYRLWNGEYPGQLAYCSIAELSDYLSRLQDKRHLFASGPDGAIVGWAMAFTRDGERWFAIIVDRAVQGKGIGTLLLERLKFEATELCGWVSDSLVNHKLDGSPYASPLPFYTRNGFKMLAGERLETDKLSAVKIVWKSSDNDI